jgi:hypothetical protein
MVRLTNTQYNRPPTTYQEGLTPEQVKEKLQDHERVEDISTIPLHTDLRYFAYKKDPTTGTTERLFRVGGKLINKDNHNKYVVLSNGKQSWSVNTETSVFFRRLTVEEVHEKYAQKIEKLQATIRHLQKKLQKS